MLLERNKREYWYADGLMVAVLGGCFILLALFPVWAMASGPDADDAPTWELVKQKDGIKIFVTQLPDEHLKTFRGVTLMSLDDFSAIGPIMDDYDFVASWLHMVSEIDGIARTSEDDKLIRLVTRLPWPVSDRDVVLHVGMVQNAKNYAVRIPFHEVTGILAKQKNYVRIPEMRGFFLFEPLQPGKIRMTLQTIVDPAGHIPDWLANMIMMDIPFYSLKQLKSVINSATFQHQHLGYYKLPPSWGDAVTLSKSNP